MLTEGEGMLGMTLTTRLICGHAPWRRMCVLVLPLLLSACFADEAVITTQFRNTAREPTKPIIGIYSLPERRLVVHLEFDAKGKPKAPPTEATTPTAPPTPPMGLSSLMAHGPTVVVRMPQGAKFDEHIVVQSTDGFLTKISTDATDQTSAAIKAVLDDFASIAPAGGGGVGAAAMVAPVKSPDKTPTPASLRANAIINAVIDPYPDTAGGINASVTSFNANYADRGLCLTLKQPPPAITKGEPLPANEKDEKAQAAETSFAGVVIPMVNPLAAQIRVMELPVRCRTYDTMQTDPTPAVLFNLDTLMPSRSEFVMLDVSRTFWVQHVTAIDFEQGMFKNVDVNRKSVVQAVAALPIDVLKAILSVPAEIIRFRINYDVTEKNLSGAEKDLLKARADLAAARQGKSGSTGSGTPAPSTTP